MRKVPKFEFNGRNDFLEKLEKGETSILEEMLKSIEWGIEHGSKSITVFELHITSYNSKISFKMDKEKWEKSLSDMLEKSVKYEEYELSAKIKNVQEKLEKSK